MAHGGNFSPYMSSASSAAAADRAFPAADPPPPCPLIQVHISTSHLLPPYHEHCRYVPNIFPFSIGMYDI